MSGSFLGYASKEDLLIRAVSGKRIVHVGAVGCTLQTVEEKMAAAGGSVHALLSRISTCVGIDVDAEGVQAMSRLFDNLIVADIHSLTREEIPLPSIDAFVAGDVIEHLSDPGGMLESIGRLSGPETRLVLTTPNAVGLPNFVRYCRGRSIDGEDHVCSFNRFTLENLLRRHGWIIDELYACHQSAAERRYGRKLFRLGTTLLKRYPHLGGTLFADASRS
jgi:SAM-dependent methyltransferase